MVVVKVTGLGRSVVVLVELGLVELRYQAVLEVVSQGVAVSEVARWLRRYLAEGLGGLVDGSAKPLSCPHQMAPAVEARIVECVGSGRGGDHERSGSGWRLSGWCRCRVGRRSIGVWFVMG